MVEVAAGWPPGDAQADVVEFRPPDEHETRLAVQAVRLHASHEVVYGGFCRECGWAWPCVTRRWGAQLLEAAGWNDADLQVLNPRTGPWS